MASFPAPTPDDIRRIVDLIVETTRPRRVVLFGSAARDELRAGSDLDILVVVDEGVDELRTAQDLYVEMARRREPVGVDLIVATQSRFERRRRTTASVFFDADRDGRELYAA